MILSLVVVLIFSVQLHAQKQDQNELETQSQQTMQNDTLVFTVYGMDCPGCAGGLEKQVNKLESVKSSSANWREQKLKVVLVSDSVLDIEKLDKRVKKANFTLKKDSENK